MKKFGKFNLNEKSFKAVKNMHMNWYQLSVKALMTQLGKDLHTKLDFFGRRAFDKCLNEIKDEHELAYGARCLMGAKKRFDRSQNLRMKLSSRSHITNYKSTFNTDKYKVKKVDPYYKPKKFEKFPFKPVINSTPTVQSSIQSRTKRSPYRLIDEDVKEETKIKIKKQSSYSLIDRVIKSPIARVADLIMNIFKKDRKQEDTANWTKTMKKMYSVKAIMDRRKQLPGAKPYTFRMYDLVLEKDEPSMSPVDKDAHDHSPFALLENSYKYTSKQKEASNTRWLSPRIAPVLPDKQKSIGANNFLSPDILSLYEDKNGTSLGNVPNMLSAAGMNQKDKDKIVETLMEVSGVSTSFDSAVDLLDGFNFFGDSKNQIMNSTEKILDAFDRLENSLHLRQKRALDKNGFAFLEVTQIDRLLRDHNIKEGSDAWNELADYRSMSKKNRENSLWLKIEQIAKNMTITDYGRYKRTLPVTVLKPTILSPYMFSPV
uniref:HDAC_interact domain-containing protein n=1 Tax=Rhabditophanes sp. KR3021 TaxID=114890 RepID=A0AC35UET3_9BILA